jgi:hypothetical protein
MYLAIHIEQDCIVIDSDLLQFITTEICIVIIKLRD